MQVSQDSGPGEPNQVQQTSQPDTSLKQSLKTNGNSKPSTEIDKLSIRMTFLFFIILRLSHISSWLNRKRNSDSSGLELHDK
mgnify:CR=1 FL=1